MTANPGRATPARGARRELLLILLVGVAGSGLALLAVRQGWAQVRIAAPRPFPSSVVTETGQGLVPAADALAVAALATLAAVLATRRWLRRVAGVVLAAFGAGLLAAVGAGVSAAHIIAAAEHGPAASGGTAAGSVTAGPSGPGSTAAAPVTGLAAHVRYAAFPWHAVALAGAALVVIAGAAVVWRAARLPVMSSRYDAPAPARSPADPAASPVPSSPVPSGPVPSSPVPSSPVPSGPAPSSPASSSPDQAQPAAAAPAGDMATMWESLSRGQDPT
jgi:uncharacterized membrane protein (TIGR02234 family)